MKIGQLLFLGSGASLGVPVITCECDVCKSNNVNNKRLRPSVLLAIAEQKILIDCGPDFRQQALKHEITHLDGVIFTHPHYDHIEGIDELRIFAIKQHQTLPCLLSKSTEADLRERFAYIFRENPKHIVTTQLGLQQLQNERGEVDFIGNKIQYFTFEQSHMPVNGFRFGDLAYASDLKIYPETIFEDLKGVKTLIISALRYEPSHIHLSVDEAVEFAQRVGAEKTWLTHISHELDHEKTNTYLPENVRLAYDGLTIDFKVDE